MILKNFLSNISVINAGNFNDFFAQIRFWMLLNLTASSVLDLNVSSSNFRSCKRIHFLENWPSACKFFTSQICACITDPYTPHTFSRVWCACLAPAWSKPESAKVTRAASADCSLCGLPPRTRVRREVLYEGHAPRAWPSADCVLRFRKRTWQLQAGRRGRSAVPPSRATRGRLFCSQRIRALGSCLMLGGRL